MPVPSWALFRSPRPDDDNNQVHDPDVGGSPASQSSSRFGALHSNVRSMINGSSIYSSDSPRLLQPETPKTPFWGFLGRRPHSRPPPIDVISDNDAPRDSNDSRSPLRPQHTAGSYMRVIAPLQDPRVPEVVHNRHPADVPLNYGGSVDLETQQLQDEIHGRRRKRKHRRRRTQRHNHWVRRRSGSSSQDRGICFPFIKSQAARGKCVACMISGLFLTTVLAICALNLTPLSVVGTNRRVRSCPGAFKEGSWPRNPRPLHNDHPGHHNLLLPLAHPAFHAGSPSASRDS